MVSIRMMISTFDLLKTNCCEYDEDREQAYPVLVMIIMVVLLYWSSVIEDLEDCTDPTLAVGVFGDRRRYHR